MKNRKYLIEVLVIFASVMLAFLAEDWRENRQDLQDFDYIIDEIHTNVGIDIYEIGVDLREISVQIHSLERLINDGVNLPSDSLRIYLSKVLITYWPHYNTTGIDQLRNNKNEGSKPGRLMRAIHDYYLYVDWQREITPSYFVVQIDNLREFLISEGLSPTGAGENYAHVDLLENELDDYRKALSGNELVGHLKHLQNSRIHQLQTFEDIEAKCLHLQELFNPDIQVSKGKYRITFDDQSEIYSFTSLEK